MYSQIIIARLSLKCSKNFDLLIFKGSYLPLSYKCLLHKLCSCVLQDIPTQYCKEKVHTFAPEIFL